MLIANNFYGPGIISLQADLYYNYNNLLDLPIMILTILFTCYYKLFRLPLSAFKEKNLGLGGFMTEYSNFFRLLEDYEKNFFEILESEDYDIDFIQNQNLADLTQLRMDFISKIEKLCKN